MAAGDAAKLRAARALARRRAREAVERGGGDPAEAARRLWARSRHDGAFRDALVRVACWDQARAAACAVARVQASRREA